MKNPFLPALMFAGIMSLTFAPVLSPSLGAGPKGTVYQFTVPKQINMLRDGTYYCWLPENVGTVRCVIVHQHGCTREGDANPMMGDVQWTTLAKKWHAVFIAPSLYTDVPGSNAACNNWWDINNGSCNTFLAALDTMARRCGHPEIKTIPWALWGHSGGAFWVTSMTAKFPNRIAATIAQSGSQSMSTVPAALRVPVLHHNGNPDLLSNIGEFINGRSKGALWAYAINPKVTWVSAPNAQPPSMMGHAPRDLRMIAIPWLDICLTSRLPDHPGDSALKDMDTTNAWLGDTVTKAIAPAAGYTGNKLRTDWFPNEYFAKLWVQYQAEGTIKDSTPPPAPYNLSGTYSNRQIRLNWDCDADLETGIKTFIIYRNGVVYQTIQYPNAPQTLFTLEKGFQRWEDGDQPDPSPAPAMTFTDNGVTDTGTYAYQVACVNWSGVGGDKSGAIALTRGLVTAVKPAAEAQGFVKRSAPVCRTVLGAGLDIGPGLFDIYDIRGRLRATVDLKARERIDADNIAGAKAGNALVVVVRNRAK